MIPIFQIRRNNVIDCYINLQISFIPGQHQSCQLWEFWSWERSDPLHGPRGGGHTGRGQQWVSECGKKIRKDFETIFFQGGCVIQELPLLPGRPRQPGQGGRGGAAHAGKLSLSCHTSCHSCHAGLWRPGLRGHARLSGPGLQAGRDAGQVKSKLN